MNTDVLEVVALDGITGSGRSPAAPRLPDELARDALACLDAGAAIVHTHAHDPSSSPSATIRWSARTIPSTLRSLAAMAVQTADATFR